MLAIDSTMENMTQKGKVAALAEIKKFLIANADTIQKTATDHHKEILGGKRFRSEIIGTYQKNHIEIVKQLAKHLETSDIKKGEKVFKQLGETLAKDAVKDQLTIEEATDGVIFLKQAVWKLLKEHGYLEQLTTDEFYSISQNTGTYVDVVVSKISFAYHQYYSEKKELQVKQKNEFIGLISHELKTPVTSIKAFAQVLQSRFAKAGDEKAALLLKKMDGQLDKLTGLIEDLLDVTKIETGKLQFHESFFDFNELIGETVEEMQRTTQKHTLITKFDTTTIIYGDRDRIGQVLINLLTNAIKYSPYADKIIISTTVQKNSITLSVQDFGVGIPKKAQDKVFDQFFRVTGKNEETFSGMGLGLYVSAEIIRRHNGIIWVESKRGKGSTFCFTLPVKKRRIVSQKNTGVDEEMKHA